MAGLVDKRIKNSYKSVLRVDDDTNGVDSTAKYIGDGEGTSSVLSISTTKTGIGTVSPDSLLEIAEDSANAELTISAYHDTEATTSKITFRKGDGTEASPALVDNNAVLGTISFQGYDGDSFAQGAKIEARAEGVPSSSDMASELTFWTTPDSSQTALERLTIGQAGNANLAGNYASWILGINNSYGGPDSTDNLGLGIQCGKNDGSGTNYAIGIYDGDGSSVGFVTFSSGTVSYGAFTANHDVELPSSDNAAGYPYGTLVEHTEVYYKQKNGADLERGILYKVQKSSSAYSKSVLGAYSNKYGHDDNLHQIYVLGDGHILCCGEKGNVAIGDGICTSSTSGVGMRADKLSMIIGIAQEEVSFSGSESKLVAVQYGLQQFTPWE